MMDAQRKGPPRQKAAPECTRAGGNSGSQYTTAPADLLLGRLDQVHQTGADQWIARCPAHDDRSPSLSIKQADDRVLVHCFAGCEAGSVLAAVGLSLADLYDRPLAHHKTPLNRYQRRRHGQAAEALKALVHEINVVWVCAEQMHSGFNLDPSDRERLTLAMSRIKAAGEVCS